MRKLHVAIVAPSLQTLGGQAVQADRLVRAWCSDLDVNAWFVASNPAPPRWMAPAVRYKWARNAVMLAQYVPRLPSALAGADLVHVFAAPYARFWLAPLPAVAASRTFARPVVLNYRNGEAADHLQRSPIARAVMASADRIVVPSQYLVDVLMGFGLHATAIANVIDLDRFRFRDREPLRPRVLSTRNFHELYNVECTIRAFRIVQTCRPDASLTLVGGGPLERHLRSLVEKLRLAQVEFLGYVDQHEIHRVYADHDIYIQSPNVDNMPNSVIEAFASGLPVVSTNAGGVPVLVAHERDGLLADVHDHRALAAGVLRLLAQPDFARRLAQAARVKCEAFTWAAVRERWLKLYDEVVTAPVARRASVPTHVA